MIREALVGWALLFAGFLGWLLVGAMGWTATPASSLLADQTVHAMALPIPGLLVGLALVVLRSEGDAPESPALDLASGRIILVAATAGLVLSLAAAVVGDALSPVRATLIGVCGLATLLILFFTLETLRRAEGLFLESHWGGLGGGLGGWRISPAAVLVFLLLVFASATVAVGLYDPHAKSPDETAAGDAASGSPATEGLDDADGAQAAE
ncbi:MAG: hypothetical protein Q8Q88_21930 [Phenylobacterium sp.]|uniref:hypothetical protein n=1 Tax=Phenylobacterium sp. TaxID=1871053 RepID=UPI00273580AB|nr:hypothetical protein [Phenylobacterium sp.]MDP3749699.1 hypothetical protein [Phenylobacterium sp.]